MTTPLVTVTMTAFQHEAWVEQSIESVLTQETTFEFDIVVGEDHSADRTREILQSVARRAGSRLQLILPGHNLGHGGNALYAQVLRAARGKYLAFLDGDDFWTDRRKLQRQVQLLETDPTLAISFHQADVLMPDGTLAAQPYTALSFPRRTTMEDLCQDNFIPSCSAVVRSEALQDLPEQWVRQPFGDWLLYLCAARHGDIAFEPAVMGIYRHHGRGAWSRMTRRQQLETTIQFLTDVALYFPHLSARLALGRFRRTLELAEIHAQNGDLTAARLALGVVLAGAEPEMRRLATERLSQLLDSSTGSSDGVTASRGRLKD